MPLVLVSNEVNATDQFMWKDITGVQYHYPNGYRNLITPGTEFIYYRGIRRASGTRDRAEISVMVWLARCGAIQKIPTDAPKANWVWYCAIEDYEAFLRPVPAKLDGVFFGASRATCGETECAADDGTYARILEAAGIAPQGQPPAGAEAASLPPMEAVTLPSAYSTLLHPPPPGATAGSGTRGRQRRRSRASKMTAIGRKRSWRPGQGAWRRTQAKSAGWRRLARHLGGISSTSTRMASWSRSRSKAHREPALSRLNLRTTSWKPPGGYGTSTYSSWWPIAVAQYLRSS